MCVCVCVCVCMCVRISDKYIVQFFLLLCTPLPTSKH